MTAPRITPTTARARRPVRIQNRRKRLHPKVLAIIDRMGPIGVERIARAVVDYRIAELAVRMSRPAPTAKAEQVLQKAKAHLEHVMDAPTLEEQWACGEVRLAGMNWRGRDLKGRARDVVDAVVQAFCVKPPEENLLDLTERAYEGAEVLFDLIPDARRRRTLYVVHDDARTRAGSYILLAPTGLTDAQWKRLLGHAQDLWMSCQERLRSGKPYDLKDEERDAVGKGPGSVARLAATRLLLDVRLISEQAWGHQTIAA